MRYRFSRGVRLLGKVSCFTACALAIGFFFGPGPDYESYEDFFREPGYHYFELGNVLLAGFAQLIGLPAERYQLVVYVATGVMVCTTEPRNVLGYILLCFAAVVLTTGGYRIGLSAVVLAYVLFVFQQRPLRLLGLILPVLVHRFAIVPALVSLSIGLKRWTVIIGTISVLAITSVLFSRDEVLALFAPYESAIETHLYGDVSEHSPSLRRWIACLYGLVFLYAALATRTIEVPIAQRKEISQLLWVFAGVSLASVIYPNPGLTRLLIFGKVLVLFSTAYLRRPGLVLLSSALLIGALPLRNEYFMGLMQ